MFKFIKMSLTHFVKRFMAPVALRKMNKLDKRKLRSFHNDVASQLIWVDCELTGLDVNKDRILEIACLITDSNLKVISDIELIIYQPPDVLASMNPWCIENHGNSGLTKACEESKCSIKDADIILTQFVEKYTPPGKCCLAGSTVYMDRWFIKKELPNFENHLHYRIIDVTSIKELCKRWNYEKYKVVPPKKLNHRALDDIKDSIEELRFYRNSFFILGDDYVKNLQ